MCRRGRVGYTRWPVLSGDIPDCFTVEMTWADLSVLGLEFEIVAAAIIGWSAYRSINAIWERAVSSPRADAGRVNERGHDLGVIRAETLLGVGLIAIGFLCQLVPYFAGSTNGLQTGTAKAIGILLFAVPLLMALIGFKTVVPRLVEQSDSKRVLTTEEKAELGRTGKVPKAKRS